MSVGAGAYSRRFRPRLGAFLCLLVLGCGGSAPPAPAPTPVSPRSFALGFTAFPHARSLAALADALAVVARDGDMDVLHFDDGVPWQEALEGAPYDPEYEADLDRQVAAVPPGHVVYLAVTPIAFERDRLAPHRGAAASEPLTSPWSRRAFDDPAVIDAFTNHCERMIATFSPRYFAYAIEANILLRLAPEKWAAFTRLAVAVYARLKARHPTLPIFLTLQAEFFHENPAGQTAALAPLLSSSDFIAVSAYPYTSEGDPERLRPDLFTALAALAPAKPFAVAETGWPAESVTAPYPVFIPETEERQRLYVERLLGDADRLSAVFVSWFLTRDYDDLWDAELQYLPTANLVRLWKDTGLYAGDGRARSALTPWRAALARRLSR